MQLEKSYEILCKAFNDESKTILEVKHQPWALLDWFSECLDRSCFNVFIIYPSHSTLESSSQKRTMLFLTLVKRSVDGCDGAAWDRTVRE